MQPPRRFEARVNADDIKQKYKMVTVEKIARATLGVAFGVLASSFLVAGLLALVGCKDIVYNTLVYIFK